MVRYAIEMPSVDVGPQWRDPENLVFEARLVGVVTEQQLDELADLVAKDWWRLGTLGWLGDAAIHSVHLDDRVSNGSSHRLSWMMDSPGGPLDRLEVHIEVLRRMVGWWAHAEGFAGSVSLHFGVESRFGSEFESPAEEAKALRDGMASARWIGSWLVGAFERRLSEITSASGEVR